MLCILHHDSGWLSNLLISRFYLVFNLSKLLISRFHLVFNLSNLLISRFYLVFNLLNARFHLVFNLSTTRFYFAFNFWYQPSDFMLNLLISLHCHWWIVYLGLQRIQGPRCKIGLKGAWRDFSNLLAYLLTYLLNSYLSVYFEVFQLEFKVT